MRDTETILNIIRDRANRKLPVEDVYRQLYNPAFYLEAYGRISRNDGAMTPGTTQETVDGMSLEKIGKLIEDVRHERYRWTPVRRTHIPKKNGKMRPLGIPTWSDKLMQEVMQTLLEAYYERRFYDCSHGFRPGRGCHTALKTIERVWKGTKWFIEGDIKGCFDNINHKILLDIIREDIHDNRFVRMIENLLSAGYMENWKYGQTLSGTPQGGIISPLLANIYLHKLDEFVEKTLIPKYTRGQGRKRNPEYRHIEHLLVTARKHGNVDEILRLTKLQKQTPTYLVDDPEYRRLRYVRYADDFLLGFAGPRSEAEQIKEELRTFLRDQLKLEMSEEKTLITHAATEMARFLNYQITAKQENTYLNRTTTRYVHGVRAVNGKIILRMPEDVVEQKCGLYKKNGEPVHRTELLNDSDYDIVMRYGLEYRGIVQYYLLASNVMWLNRLERTMEVSLLKTLACKHKATVMQMVKKYKTNVKTDKGPRKAIAVTVPRKDKNPLVATFAGIPLCRKPTATIFDQKPKFYTGRNQLIDRLLAEECEICGSTDRIQVHHIRKLADLKVPGRKEKPEWMKLMSARRRKTLVVCFDCHWDIHTGRPLKRKVTE